MPELKIYHLEKTGAFHFGARGVEQEETALHFPADSLFSAIVVAWIEQGADPDELAAAFPRREEAAPTIAPPFLLTSLFPIAGSLRFYPAPPPGWMLSQEKLDALHRAHRLKEVKKIKFISAALFRKMLNGEWLDAWMPTAKTPSDNDRGVYLQGGALWLERKEINALPAAMREKPKQGDHLKALRKANVWKVSKTPRVSVDRVTSASGIFHTGRLRHNVDCGFWFGINWQTDNAEIRNGIEQALALLADSGLGAERNAGYGYFTLQEKDAIQLPASKQGDFFITLSRYNPKDDELPDIFADNRVAYNLASVAGWLQSPHAAAQRRRRLWLFQEGSVLRQPHNTAPGALVDVRPVYKNAQLQVPHPVWRYGLAFPVKINPAGGAK